MAEWKKFLSCKTHSVSALGAILEPEAKNFHLRSSQLEEVDLCNAFDLALCCCTGISSTRSVKILSRMLALPDPQIPRPGSHVR